MSETRNPNPDTINPEPFLPCERLDVYRVALEFRHSLAILDTVRNISSQRDQIFRASDSIVFNIAEGAGRMARADKRRHYSYAKGSAMECGAALALLNACGALRDIAYLERRLMIIRIVQMLSRLCGPPQ
jgi:four helix bundle protein